MEGGGREVRHSTVRLRRTRWLSLWVIPASGAREEGEGRESEEREGKGSEEGEA